MTGDLNMGGNNINNANNITASGTTTSGTLKSTGNTNVGGNLTVAGTSTMTGALQVNNTINSSSSITAAGNVTAGNQVIAHNGYGDTIWFGGDGAGSDYEIRLLSAKPLSIFSPNAADYTTVLNVYKNAKIQQRLSTNGYDPNDIPVGWAGGIRTWDIFAGGTIAVLPQGVSGKEINSYNQMAAYMQTDGNIFASGNIQGKTIKSTGRTTIGEYAQINGIASVGDSCDSNGLQGRTSAGQLLSCVNGVWANTTSLKRMVFIISGETKNYGDICQKYLDNNGYTALGWVASGSDVCTEDEEYCTIDNVRCYALKSQ